MAWARIVQKTYQLTSLRIVSLIVIPAIFNKVIDLLVNSRILMEYVLLMRATLVQKARSVLMVLTIKKCALIAPVDSVPLATSHAARSKFLSEYMIVNLSRKSLPCTYFVISNSSSGKIIKMNAKTL